MSRGNPAATPARGMLSTLMQLVSTHLTALFGSGEPLHWTPLSEVLDGSTFSNPSSWDEAANRVASNGARYRAVYLACLAGSIGVFGYVHPSYGAALVWSSMAGLALLRIPSGSMPQLTVGEWHLNDPELRQLAWLSIPVGLYATGTLRGLLWAIGVPLGVTLLHAIYHVAPLQARARSAAANLAGRVRDFAASRTK